MRHPDIQLLTDEGTVTVGEAEEISRPWRQQRQLTLTVPRAAYDLFGSELLTPGATLVLKGIAAWPEGRTRTTVVSWDEATGKLVVELQDPA